MPLSPNDLRAPTIRRRTVGASFRKSTAIYLSLSALLLGCFLTTGCTTNLQSGMLIDRIKNRGPINISTSNPYLVANQYLEFQRKESVDIRQFLSSRGAPAALEIQKPLFEDARVFLYYPENGQYYILTEGIDHWKVSGPHKLSGRKMYQVHDVVKGVPVAR